MCFNYTALERQQNLSNMSRAQPTADTLSNKMCSSRLELSQGIGM